MPRGYLKGQRKTVGKKIGRGGGSKSYKPSSTTCSYDEKKCYRSKMTFDLVDDDYFSYEEDMDDYYSSNDEYMHESKEDKLSPELTSSTMLPTSTNMQQCPICCDDYASLTPLMKQCNHPPCCQNCLREIYINQAQQDITNYPLRCYHPSCTKVIRDTQLFQHQLVRTKEELKRHYRFTNLAKAYKDRRKKVIHCPNCEMPHVISSTSEDVVVNCKECHTKFTASHYHRTIAAVEAFTHDNIGHNDGWARCPRCKIIISKGFGCDHMSCVCGHHFSWNEALNKKDKKYSGVAVVASKMIDTLDTLESFAAR